MAAGSGLLAKSAAYKEHIVKQRADGLSGEVAKVRADMKSAVAAMAALAVEEWTNAIAATTNSIKTSIATAIAAVTYSGTDLNGATGAAAFIAPRRVSVTQVEAGDHYQGTITVKGLDAQGLAISDTIALTVNPGGANTTTGTTKYFAKVTSIVVPAQKDALGHFLFGEFGATLGLVRPIKTRAALAFIFKEVVDGAVVTTGSAVDAATAPPYGAYTPAAAPNGAHDYAVYYEYDASKG